MSVLKKVYEAKDANEAQELRGLLETAGIPAVVRDAGTLSALRNALLRNADGPTVWVLEDPRFISRALRIAHDHRTKGERQPESAPPQPEEPATPTGSWLCPSCGQYMDSQFGDCQNCGDPRP